MAFSFIWAFIIIGSLLFGAFVYLLWIKFFKKILLLLFSGKKIMACKNELRILDIAKIPENQRIDVYVENQKIKDLNPEIIKAGEKLYFKQKPFDDLVDWLSRNEFYFDEILPKKFKIFTTLNKNHEIVKTLIDYKWKPKLIKKALIELKGGLKTNGRIKTKPSLPSFKEQIKQDIEKTTNATRDREFARGKSRTNSNESRTNPSIPGIIAQPSNIQNGEIVAKRESMERAKKYFS